MRPGKVTANWESRGRRVVDGILLLAKEKTIRRELVGKTSWELVDQSGGERVCELIGTEILQRISPDTGSCLAV